MNFKIFAFFLIISFSTVINAKCPICSEATCALEKNELSEHELRLDVPWKLHKYNGFTVEENLKIQMNKQINLELQAFYTYLSMSMYFDRDYVALHGFHKFFKKASNEELSHATQMMEYLNTRGVATLFTPIGVPCDNALLAPENTVSRQSSAHCENVEAKIVRKPDGSDSTFINCDWKDPLTAITAARQLEMNVYRNLKTIHALADKQRDPNLTDFLETFLDEQVKSIKELSDLLTQLKRVEPCLGYHMIDKELDGKP